MPSSVRRFCGSASSLTGAHPSQIMAGVVVRSFAWLLKGWESPMGQQTIKLKERKTELFAHKTRTRRYVG